MNIVLIDIDTLRADHLGCYGYHRPTSPTVDRLASEGMLFENCLAPGIPTTPAHATIYTGMHPIAHRIVTHGGAADLDNRLPFLPEQLERAGYTTCAIDNLYDIKRWFARGYEFYINPARRHRLGLMVTCDEINRRAIPWLKMHAREKFFLFIHYWDLHTPYLPPARYRNLFYQGDPFDPANKSLEAMDRQIFGEMWRDFWFPKLGGYVTDAEYIVSLYDGEIRYLDDGIARLLEALDETGAAEDTLVLLTADHGESMYQHDIFFDHHGLYECNIRVPLIVRWPGRAAPGSRFTPMAQHPDLAPTLLDAAGAKIPPETEGQSLVPILTGESVEPLYDAVVLGECTWQAKWGLRTDRHKFILSRQPDLHGSPVRELYDLSHDPGEEINLIDTHPDLARSLEDRLESWIARRLESLGLPDPLVEQGITLGNRWVEWNEKRGKG
ncbi:MAG: sulfatase [Armatimonadetes bacterium]|nr:sulfatase [Armatimonadota bacterium]